MILWLILWEVLICPINSSEIFPRRSKPKKTKRIRDRDKITPVLIPSVIPSSTSTFVASGSKSSISPKFTSVSATPTIKSSYSATSLTGSSATESNLSTPSPNSRSWTPYFDPKFPLFYDWMALREKTFGISNGKIISASKNGITTDVLSITYPAGSRNPGASGLVIGGLGIYALTPIDLSKQRSISLSYKVFFPAGFNFVKGGKLPGLYGGHPSCSGGSNALDCFSSRFMFRSKGAGEIYIYVDQSVQNPGFCSVPPFTLCNRDYGASVGRGSFLFQTGQWNSIQQIITLNTVKSSNYKADGSITIIANGAQVINYNQIVWRKTEDVLFEGIQWDTFFGGSDDSWITPKTQNTLFTDVNVTIMAI